MSFVRKKKRNGRASYVIKVDVDGNNYAVTHTSWDVPTGRRGSSTHYSRNGTIYTRARFKAWCKKNDLTPTAEEVAGFPTKTWSGAS